MKLILQSEAAECGLACLAMVADAHGSQLDMSDLRRRFSISLKGITLATLIRHAEALDFSARPLRIELEELVQLRLPCILHWNFNHFVVLKKVSRNKVTILDPGEGEKSLQISEVSKHFTGVALELSPSTQFQPANNRKTIRLSELTGRIVGLRRVLFQILLMTAALEVFSIAAPLFNQFVIDEVILTGDREFIPVLAMGFGMILVIQTFIGILRSWVLLRLSIDVRVQWTVGLFTHMMKLPPSFFEKRHLGDIVSRFGSITSLQGTLTTAIVSAILDAIMGVAAIAMMLTYSTTLSAVVVASISLYGLLRLLFYREFKTATRERLVLSAKENSYFLETIRAVIPIRLAGFETARRVKWQNLLVDVFNRDVKTQRLGIIFSTASTFITGASALVFFAFGARQIIDNTLTLGMLMAFSSYASTFTARANSLVGYSIALMMLSLHAERLADLALEPQETTQQADFSIDVNRLPASIELRNVGFRYAEGEPWVFRGINMCVMEGQSVALVGGSGCGKTTLLKIILGLLPPTEGVVLLGGVEINKIGLGRYRSILGAVLQDDHLMAGTLLDNICLFEHNPNVELIKSSAAAASIHDEIERMPMGYQTLVGDMGSTLSGGQRQRIILARALYRNPRILILDEATSHVDGAKEAQINLMLAERRMTKVLVSHRKESIQGVDRVIELFPGLEYTSG